MDVSETDVVNIVLSLASLGICIFVIGIYLHRRKSYSLFSMLFFHVIMCAVFVTMNVVYLFLFKFLFTLNMEKRTLELILNVGMTTKTFIFISGALLAVDRTILMTFPVKYTKLSLAPKIVLLFAFLLPLTVGIVIAVAVNVEFSDPFRALRIAFITLMAGELVFHIIFAVQFARFFKNRAFSNSTHQSSVNHITLFQMVSLTVLVLFPHAIIYVDVYYYNSLISTQLVKTIFEDLLILLHIAITSSFTCYKLMRRSAVMRVSHGTVNSIHSKVRSTH